MGDVTHLAGGWVGRGASFGTEGNPPPPCWGAGRVVFLLDGAGLLLLVGVELLLRVDLPSQFHGTDRDRTLSSR